MLVAMVQAADLWERDNVAGRGLFFRAEARGNPWLATDACGCAGDTQSMPTVLGAGDAHRRRWCDRDIRDGSGSGVRTGQGAVMDRTRILAFVTGMVDQELLGRSEYLAAESRIIKAQLNGRLKRSDVEARIAPVQGSALRRPPHHSAPLCRERWIPVPFPPPLLPN